MAKTVYSGTIVTGKKRPQHGTGLSCEYSIDKGVLMAEEQVVVVVVGIAGWKSTKRRHQGCENFLGFWLMAGQGNHMSPGMVGDEECDNILRVIRYWGWRFLLKC